MSKPGVARSTKDLPDEELEAFLKKVDKLRGEGLTFTVIGSRLGVSRTTIADRRARWARIVAAREEEGRE
jgi:hypothetical protein